MTFNPGVWPFYSEECRRDVDALLQEGGSLSAYRANKKYGLGPRDGSWAYRLEREIESKFNVKHAVACNSGTAALHIAIACSLGRPGSPAGEIVVSPFTFSATAAAILHAGYTPVFADVDPSTYSITKETVKRVLTKRTKAILPVHLFGRFDGLDDLHSLGLPVLEDACQSVGAMAGETYAGCGGVAGAYSFNGGKNVPAGECGAMVTGSQRRCDQARLLANHAENFGAKFVGWNYRPNELTCCVAWHGLQQVHTRNFERIALAKRLSDQMVKRGLPFLWQWEVGGTNVFYVAAFTLLFKRGRAGFIKRMKERGVTVGAGYIQPPLHKYPAFRQYAQGELPVVEELSSKTLCLLDCVRPPATLADMDYVAKCMEESL